MLLAFALALVLRIGWVTWANREFLSDPAEPTPASALQYDDERLHWELASNLVTRGALVSDDGRYAARMPLYPLFLTPFAFFGGRGMLAAKLAQAIFGALAAPLAGMFAANVAGRRAAILAGILVAIDPFGVFFANLLLTETLFTVLLLWLCKAWFDTMRGARAPGWSVAILGAAGLLTRSSVAALLPVFWLLLAYRQSEKRITADQTHANAGDAGSAPRAVSFGRRWMPLLVCVTVMAIPLGVWSLRNWAVIHTAAPLSTNGGVTLYDAQGPQARGDSDQRFLSEMSDLAELREGEVDRTLARRAIEQMKRDPGRVLTLAGVKFLRTWSLTPNVAEHRSGVTAVASAIYTAGLLLLAACGIWRARRIRWFPTAVLLPILYFTLVHMVYVGSVRYRVPLMPVLAVAAGAFLPKHGNATIGHTQRK